MKNQILVYIVFYCTSNTHSLVVEQKNGGPVRRCPTKANL